MDVPISMSVLDDTFIAAQGITDLHEAMLFVPDVTGGRVRARGLRPIA